MLLSLFRKVFCKNDYFGGEYSKGYIDYPGVGKITDKQVADHAINHLHWWDRFDARKVCDAATYSQLFLEKCIDEPKKKNWKY